MPIKPIKRKYLNKPMNKPSKAKKQRLGLRVSMGVDLLLELPEGVLSIKEQSILERIKNVNAGVGPKIGQRLNEADYQNLKKIAAKYQIKLP